MERLKVPRVSTAIVGTAGAFYWNHIEYVIVAKDVHEIAELVRAKELTRVVNTAEMKEVVVFSRQSTNRPQPESEA